MGARSGGGGGAGGRTILSEKRLGKSRVLSKKNGEYTFKSGKTKRVTKNWDQAMFYWNHYA